MRLALLFSSALIIEMKNNVSAGFLWFGLVWFWYVLEFYNDTTSKQTHTHSTWNQARTCRSNKSNRICAIVFEWGLILNGYRLICCISFVLDNIYRFTISIYTRAHTPALYMSPICCFTHVFHECIIRAWIYLSACVCVSLFVLRSNSIWLKSTPTHMCTH